MREANKVSYHCKQQQPEKEEQKQRKQPKDENKDNYDNIKTTNEK